MKARKSINLNVPSAMLPDQKSNIRRYLSVLLLLFVLVICSAIGIYALFAHEVTKVDVSDSVIVPENYQNLLVLDVTIPAFDTGRIGEDILLHNGVAGSDPRDILRPFDPTDWYSDHDGDGSFDGNRVSGNTEAIVSSNDDRLSPDDTVRKTGLCLIESFDYSAGIGEQYIDSDRSQSYTDGEAIVRTSTTAGEIYPGEVVRSGAADMTPFPANIRFADGIAGSMTPARYHDGEAIVLDADPAGILSDADTILTPGIAHLSLFPSNVVYSDFDDDSEYDGSEEAIEEAIIADNAAQGQLDVGSLDGTGVDTVIEAGPANLKPMPGELRFADDDGDSTFTAGELLLNSPDDYVNQDEVIKPGSANLKPMAGLSFADDSDDGLFDAPELIVENTGDPDILENADTIVSAGNADLKAFADVERFIDNDEDGVYDDDECIVRDGGIAGKVEPGDIEKPGLALLVSFGSDYLFTDHNSDGKYTEAEAIFKDANGSGLIDNNELVTPGYAALKSFPSSVWFVDAGSSGYNSDEAVIISDDDRLSSSDTIVRPGPVFLTAFDVLRWADVNDDEQYDDGELITNSPDNILSDGEVIKPGYCNLRNFPSDYYEGQLYSDGNNSNTYSSDELIIYSDDQILDANDSVFIPGEACLRHLQGEFPSGSSTRFIDTDENGQFDPEEAIVYDPNVDSALDEGDSVVRTQPGAVDIKSFGNEIVYIDDPNGDAYFQGDSDNNVTWANDPDAAQDEAVLNDPLGEKHLALDSGDTVLRPGGALLTAFSETDIYYTDDGNGEYDGGESNEAIIRDSKPYSLLDNADEVIVTGRALRDFWDERFIDNDHNGTYTVDEAVWRDLSDNDLLDPGEIVKSGYAALIPIGYAAKYLDADNSDSFDGGEAIVIDNEPTGFLDINDQILKPGGADIMTFNADERYVDCDGDGNYTNGEPVVDNDTGDLQDKDSVVLNPGTLVNLPENIKFIDADDSESPLFTIESGIDDITDAPDGLDGWKVSDDLRQEFMGNDVPLPVNVFAYPEPSGSRWLIIEDIVESGDMTVRYIVKKEEGKLNICSKSYSPIPEAIIEDSGAPWRLDLGELNGVDSSDRVIVPGAADIKDIENIGDHVLVPSNAEINAYIDADRDDFPDPGEALIADNAPEGILDISDVVYGRVESVTYTGPDCFITWIEDSASAWQTNLYAFESHGKFLNNNASPEYEGQPMINDSGAESGVWDESDLVMYDGTATSRGLSSGWGIAKYVDGNHDGHYDAGECILESIDAYLDAVDAIVTPGAADIKGFPDEMKFTDDERANGSLDQDEAIVNDADGDDMIDPGETIVSGKADTVGEDRNRNGWHYIDEGEDLDGDNPGDGPYPGFPDVAADHKAYMYACQTMPGSLSPLKYIDANSDGVFSADEVIISDGGPGGLPNGLLDVGDLDGNGTDRVLISGEANFRGFSRAEKFVDADRDATYDAGEAIVYDWYDSVTFEGERILAGDHLSSTGSLAYQAPGARTRDCVLLASDTNCAAMTQLNASAEHRYVDSNHSGIYDGFYPSLENCEAIIWSANNQLDEGDLNGTGDRVLAAGYASMTLWPVNLKWADSDHDGEYESNEAIVHDAECDGFITSIGTGPGDDRIIVPGDADFKDFTKMKYVDANGDQNFTAGELVVNDVNEDNMAQKDEIGDPGLVPSDLLHPFASASADYRYCDANQNDSFDSQEAIVRTSNDILEVGDEGKIVAAGDAGLRAFSSLNMFVDHNHDNSYDSDEAIIYGDGDGTFEATDQIIVPGAATSFDGTNYKYSDANRDGEYTDGELIVNDLNGDNMVAGNEIVTAGTALLQNFAAIDRYADSDHNDQYDYDTAAGFGEAIIENTTGDVDKMESSDEIRTAGYADLQAFDGTSYRYSDADRNNEFTDGELIVNDHNGDDNVDTDEIVRAGLAGLKAFPADVMYIDADGDDVYSVSEAIVRTTDAVLGSDDEVLASGIAELHLFEENIYRFADADHDDMYDAGEAIIVEADGETVDDILEDSDVVVLDGEADIERFPSDFVFLDDGAKSGAYEDGEAIVNDSDGNSLLDPDEIVTGGRSALRKFAGGEKYTDIFRGGERNSQYDQDEAIIRDGNSNGELDIGPLDGTWHDEVLTAGKAGLARFDADERYVDANDNGRYDGGRYGSSNQYGDSSEDIYLDRDNNGIVTLGDDGLEYLVVENTGTATGSDLSAVKLWADRDKDAQFEPDADDTPAVVALIPDASNPKVWYEGPATAPPLSTPSARASIDYTMPTDGQRFFVTVDTNSTPTDGSDIQMGLPLNGVKTLFGLPGPSDGTLTNAYVQKIDFADPDAARITSPSVNAVLYGPIVLRAEVSDTIGVGKVEFYNGLPGGGNTPIAVDDDGAPWEASWDSSSVECGFYTLYARVYDRTYLRPPQTWGIDHYTDSQGVSIAIAISSTIRLVEGWNLISVPVEAFDSSIDSVLSSIDYTAVWAYDAAASKWLRYDLEGPGFLNDLNAIQMGVGYWILISSSGALNINGAMPEMAIPLQEGWNLVGCNSLTSSDIADATSSINGEFSVWTFDPETDRWLGYTPGEPSDLNTIEPGRGYWIYTPESCTWTLPGHGD